MHLIYRIYRAAYFGPRDPLRLQLVHVICAGDAVQCASLTAISAPVRISVRKQAGPVATEGEFEGVHSAVARRTYCYPFSVNLSQIEHLYLSELPAHPPGPYLLAPEPARPLASTKIFTPLHAHLCELL
jgi:hypothetical protein